MAGVYDPPYPIPYNPIRGTTSAPAGVMTAYNVKDFGAVGDGVHDDTEAIQAALNSGGNVWVPYTVTGYLCGALSIPASIALVFDRGAKLVAPSSLAAPWIALKTGVVHQGTAIVGGTFDASAVTSSLVTEIISAGVESCPNLRIEGNRIINAPGTGIYVSESTYTQEGKWVRDNSVEGHGIAVTGYGIYADYIGSIEIAGNFVTATGPDDAIELGHSGDTYLGIDAYMDCHDNVVVNGQINFPLSDHARIAGNTVIGNTIQNDTNTANDVVIIGNKVMGATPASGYAGIRVSGLRGIIQENQVEVTTGDGISGTGLTSAIVTGNYIKSTSATPSGSAINDGTGGGTSIIADNQLDGVSGGGFLYVFTLTGTQHDVHNNKVINGGCFDGIHNSGTYSTFEDNDLTVYNTPLPLSGGGTNTFRGNRNINPVGSAVPGTAFALPASGTAWTNNTGVDGTLFVTAAGTVTDVVVQGVTVGSSLAVGQSFFVAAGGTFTLTYSVAPTLVFVGN